MDILRLARTLRHVPLPMLAARVAYRARCVLYGSPVYSLLLPDEPGPASWPAVPCLVPGAAALGPALARREFSFVGHTRTVQPGQWLPAGASALWVFNLHYHSWLHDLKAAGLRAEAEALVADWLHAHDVWHPVAWHPYPLSLRIVNWLQAGPWLLQGAGDEFAQAFSSSLLRQVAHLDHNIEHWLGGNHVIKNLKALILAGLVLPGQQRLVGPALATLLRELKQQILPDGAHVEASPSYHVQVLIDLLELAATFKKFGGAPAALTDALARMGEALAVWVHPDGGLALFNDGAVEDPTLIGKLLDKVGPDVAPNLLPQAGYARLVRGPSVVIFDNGPVGPAENPGHAHGDALSFELSVGRQRMVVNGGTYGYQHAARNTYRSSLYKSAPQVPGVQAVEVWGGFRVGRRPTAFELAVREVPQGEAVVQGHHAGFGFAGVPQVGRKLVLAADGLALLGEDTWLCKPGPARKLAVYWGIHPAVGVRLVSETEAQLSLPGGARWQLLLKTPGWRLDVKDLPYAPQFGVVQPAKQLQALGRGAAPGGSLTWLLRAVV